METESRISDDGHQAKLTRLLLPNQRYLGRRRHLDPLFSLVPEYFVSRETPSLAFLFLLTFQPAGNPGPLRPLALHLELDSVLF